MGKESKANRFKDIYALLDEIMANPAATSKKSFHQQASIIII